MIPTGDQSSKQYQYRLIIAGSGASPAPFPDEWTPETVNSWARECQRGYKPGQPQAAHEDGIWLTKRALKLWLSREVGWPKARELASHIVGFGE